MCFKSADAATQVFAAATGALVPCYEERTRGWDVSVCGCSVGVSVCVPVGGGAVCEGGLFALVFAVEGFDLGE